MKKRVTLPLEINKQKKGARFKMIDGFQRVVTLRVLEPETGRVRIWFRKKSIVSIVKELSLYGKIPLSKSLAKPYAFLLYSIQRISTKRPKQIIL
ncbi:MAG: hypothetical protein ABIJ81_03955 [Patescibacteria group bacterium]